MRKISVIIPAFNESECIGELLKRINNIDLSAIGFEMEIIVVDDGSTDATFDIASSYVGVKVVRQKNQGKGSAVQNGVGLASGDYVLIQDGDLEYSPEDYLPMLSVLNKTKINMAVYGSRIRGVIRDEGWGIFPGRKENQGLGPWLAGVLLSCTCFLLYGKWISDTLTGYKIYPLNILRGLDIKTKGFETDHEITAKLIKRRISIKEVPIKYLPRSVSEGKKIKAKDGFVALLTYCRFRIFN